MNYGRRGEVAKIPRMRLQRHAVVDAWPEMSSPMILTRSNRLEYEDGVRCYLAVPINRTY